MRATRAARSSEKKLGLLFLGRHRASDRDVDRLRDTRCIEPVLAQDVRCLAVREELIRQGDRPDLPRQPVRRERLQHRAAESADRKSTRLNSSHDQISYAVFCLKKKKNRASTAPCESTASTTCSVS